MHGFIDTDLHEVSWYFATLEAKWVLSSTDRVKISVKQPIQKWVFVFIPHLKSKMQPLNPLKTVSKVGDMSWTIAVTVHCFGMLSQVGAIEHNMTSQKRDLL